MATKNKKYLPLQIADYAYEREGEDGVPGMFHQQGLISRDVSWNEYCDFLFSNDFLNPKYRGPFRELNKLAASPEFLRMALKNIPREVWKRPDAEGIRTELRDVFGISTVVGIWSRYKQVYKVDGDFFDELVNTKDLKIPQKALSHLPAQTLYIDLSDCKGIDPIAGAFVYVINDPEGEQIAVYMETEDAVTFSYYSDFAYKDGIAEFRSLDPSTKFVAVDLKPGDYYTPQINEHANDRRCDVVKAITQVLLFLSCDSRDILENETTKATYRPSSRIRNKFSEIRMWDVGVRYGAAIRIAKEDAAAKTSSSVAGNGSSPEEADRQEQEKQRKSPRPHVRSAHWQRYHVGKGRKEIRLNWVPPTIVYGDHAIPVTIHTIKK